MGDTGVLFIQLSASSIDGVVDQPVDGRHPLRERTDPVNQPIHIEFVEGQQRFREACRSHDVGRLAVIADRKYGATAGQSKNRAMKAGWHKQVGRSQDIEQFIDGVWRVRMHCITRPCLTQRRRDVLDQAFVAGLHRVEEHFPAIVAQSRDGFRHGCDIGIDPH